MPPVPSASRTRLISLDTETTGVDLWHGAKPFFVTTCNEEDDIRYWEWDVDPETRQPIIPDEELEEVRQIIEGSSLVLQNAKFDHAAIRQIIPDINWPWDRTHDTLLAGHLIASGHPHDLTSMALQWLGVDIEPKEIALQEAVNEARRLAGKECPTWQLAKKGRSDMPSAKEKVWKYDSWLPRALAKYLGLPSDHPWWSVLEDYANTDSAVTIQLHRVQQEEIARRGLQAIYNCRLQLLPIIADMEHRGVTLSQPRLDELKDRYTQQASASVRECHAIAEQYDYELELPKSGNNKSLLTFAFAHLELPVLKRSDKTGAPSFDKEVIGDYLLALDEGSPQLRFVSALAKKRKLDTSINYMESYERFWLPYRELGKYKGWYVLHPSLNPTGTATLRFSCSNPNEQNISKKKDDQGFNVRHCFGPAPGREWWSLDAENIELRLPAYESGEEAMIDLFEHPESAPYFGSNHLLIAHVLWQKEFESCKDKQGRVDGRVFKERYADTLYQWTKNGNFAIQYGAVNKEDGTGTADRAYHQPGAQSKIESKFTKASQLSKRWIAFAKKHGYVETIPDRSIDPKRGYPLMCSRTEWGNISPTVPLAYHVQGSAMWWTIKGMIRCWEILQQVRQEQGIDGRIVMQVHDEIVFDLPKKGDPKTNLKGSNYWLVDRLRTAMKQGGEDFGIPTPVSVEFNPSTWAEKFKIV